MTSALCKKCGSKASDLAEAMLNGCINCGSKLFVISNDSQEVELEPLQKETGSKEVAIKVKGVGSYNINLDKLLKADTKNEPLLIEDKDGVVRVLFNSDD